MKNKTIRQILSEINPKDVKQYLAVINEWNKAIDEMEQLILDAPDITSELFFRAELKKIEDKKQKYIDTFQSKFS